MFATSSKHFLSHKLVSENYIAMVHSVKLHDDFPISR